MAIIFTNFLRQSEADISARERLQQAKLLAKEQPAMRLSLFTEALKALLANDLELGKQLLRLLIHVSVGFESLAEKLNISSKSLHRMLSNSGNPTSKNLLQILSIIRLDQHLTIHVEVITSNPNFEPTKKR